MIDLSNLPLLKGKKALVTGIANDQSIGYGIPKPFAPSAPIWRALSQGKARKFVEPLASPNHRKRKRPHQKKSL
jgi:enoyl-[acyl-carrier protein] reductase I